MYLGQIDINSGGFESADGGMFAEKPKGLNVDPNVYNIRQQVRVPMEDIYEKPVEHDLPEKEKEPESTSSQVQKAGFGKIGKYAAYIGAGAILYFAFLKK